MKILLTGRNGQVGWELERALPALGEVIATDRGTLDLTDADSIRRAVRDARPDVIVNAAAYTAVDKAESEAGLAMQVNGIAPGILAEEAKRLGALLVHYSTDYVFDGTKAGPYTEQDRTNPLSVYGRTKLEGEDAIAGEGGRFLTLRTSWVYGPRGKGFYPAILSQARAGNPLRVVNDQTGVPTSSAFLAKYTLPLVRRGATGVVNLVPCGETSRLGFAREILRGAGLQAKVEPISTTDTRTAAQRPLYSVLDNRVALSLLGPLPDWGEALAEIATAGRAT